MCILPSKRRFTTKGSKPPKLVHTVSGYLDGLSHLSHLSHLVFCETKCVMLLKKIRVPY